MQPGNLHKSLYVTLTTIVFMASEPELTLTEPLEADISDFLSPSVYFDPPGSQTSLAVSSPSSLSLSENFNDSPPPQPRNPGLEGRQLLNRVSSPSSPSLMTKTSFSIAERLKQTHPGLPRSVSLPRVDQVEVKQRKKVVDVDNISLDPDVVKKLRRWIMGVAIGEPSLFLSCRQI